MGTECSMPIPLNNLGGQSVRLESEFFADCRFDLWIKMGVSSDRSAQFSDGNFRPCRPKSVDVATPATLLTLITGTESAPLKIAGAEIQ